MKKIFFLIVLLFNVLAVSAQKDVTTFLGIPVGTEAARRQKLIEKGFKPSRATDHEYFEGEFNGAKVHVYIVTNNNKVYRIMVCDVNTLDEANIRIRFNTLISQFQNNKRYEKSIDRSIPESENIGYEMAVKNKVYEAAFYQSPDMQKFDTLAYRQSIRQEMLKKYTPEQLDNPTAEMEAEWDKVALDKAFEFVDKKPVWFRICKDFGKYYITMFYDNEYNKANGEDL